MINEKYQENLAETAVKIGVNIQPNQFLVINSPVETADFARKVAKAAFDAGAEDVYINYNDQKFSKIRLDNASKETLKEIPDWWSDRLNNIIDRGGAIINISAVDPDLMDEVDTEKIETSIEAKKSASHDYNEALMGNKNRWCVISVPTTNWAKKVFPEAMNGQKATDLLWNAILRSTHCISKDPIKEWHEQDKLFKERAERLNKKQYDQLHYTNDLGTDLYIGLPKNHIWSGGSEVSQDGVSFFPNLPTEEIFTAPDKYRVNGRVAASYPLIYHGKTIEDIQLEFKDGKVVDVFANKNEDLLRKIIEKDNNGYLGEVALVPYSSPISEMNILFYNTLFDENASCHLALGTAYPNSIEDGLIMTEEELDEAGINTSSDHIDFMIGTEDLKITGVNEDGSEEPIFINGNFVD